MPIASLALTHLSQLKDGDSALTNTTANINLGFLTVQQEANGYVGGLLITNIWGRPLEFRMSSPVQPNRIQQILHGGTLQGYICADVIGKALVDKTTTTVEVILTDRESVLDLRIKTETPIAWLASVGDPMAEDLAEDGALVRPAAGDRGPILCHPRFPEDAARIREVLAGIDGSIDVAEPLSRIREALKEARKMGVAHRSAA
jgi:hypothetical protein